MRNSKSKHTKVDKKGNEHLNVDEAINEVFYSDHQKNDSNPTLYLYNNTAAIDVTGNKDEDR
ncbi:hypothetical protein [Guptibacillus algicola]|uniref:hypothetical protein n=1 Tax=Guptibacillus algicola TaxID=225844 RepID=UPI001CD795B2|nr:hypothetical protein [Alkalihalobacillus algicola]MCA0988702.1 hypothetical protein [Alkalihalobacillus algicola]